MPSGWAIQPGDARAESHSRVRQQAAQLARLAPGRPWNGRPQVSYKGALSGMNTCVGNVALNAFLIVSVSGQIANPPYRK